MRRAIQTEAVLLAIAAKTALAKTSEALARLDALNRLQSLGDGALDLRLDLIGCEKTLQRAPGQIEELIAGMKGKR